MHRDRVGTMGAVVVLLPLAAPLPQDGSRPASAPRPATSVVVPAECRERPGGANNVFPFTGKGPLRYQAFLSPDAFADHEPGPLVISGLGFRGTGAGSGRSTVAEVEIRIGTLPGSGKLEDVSSRYADNLGADALVVFARAQIEIGRAGQRGPGPAGEGPWDIEIPLQKTFTYRRDRTLVLDVRVFGEGAAASSFPLDAHKESFAARLYGPPDAEDGRLQPSFGLVTRFLLKPRPDSRPASRPAGNNPMR